MSKKSKGNFVVHGMILGAASIISRLIGLAYRIPLNNVLGSEALSDYSNAYNIYSLMLLLSSLSIPLAVSKMISARHAKREYKNAYKVFKNALVFSFTVGLAFGLITFFGANFITGLMGYGDGITPALKMLSPALVIMSVLGVFRGYYQGLSNMIPTAISNVVEQIVNAVVSLVGAIYLIGYAKGLYDKGAISESMVHSMGAAGGTLGTVFGAGVALILLAYVFFLYKKKFMRRVSRDVVSRDERRSDIIKMLVITILPVIISTTIYNISSIIDSGLFGNIMAAKGMLISERKIMYGQYSGYYILLLNVPVSLASALASSTVPAVVSAFTKKEHDVVIKRADAAIRLTMMVSMACSAGYFFLAAPIVRLLFPSCQDVQAVELMLHLGFAAVVCYSLSTVSGSILQGISKMRVPVINSAISLVIHVALLSISLFAFDFKIYTLVVLDMLFSLTVCILNMRAIRKYTDYSPSLIKCFIMPASAAIIMGAIGLGINYILEKVGVHHSLSTIIAILACMIVYGCLVILFKVTDEEELKSMPGGTKIIRVAKKVHLM